MDITDMVSTDYKTFDAETRVSKLKGVFEDTNLKAVVITEDGDYAGLVTQRQMISSHLNPAQKASSVMISAPVIDRYEDVREVARLMVEGNTKVVPVFQGDDLYGVVSADDLLKEVNSNLGVLNVRDIYTENPVTVETETTVGEVINKLRENGISRIPVLDNGELVGIITLYDLLGFTVREESRSKGGGESIGGRGGFGPREGELNRMLDIPARDIMNSPVETTTPDEDLEDAVEKMLRMNYSSLVVVNDNQDVIGVMTKTDILRSLTWTDEGQMNVQITNIDLLDTMSRDDVVAIIENISEKYSEMQVLHAHVYLQKHKEKLRGNPLVMTRMMLHTNKGQFIGTGEGYGATHSIHVAKNKLERNVLSDKQVRRSDREAERLFKELGL